MKRATRKTLVQVERMNDWSFRADHARDVLDSDARQRAEIRDLRARIRTALDNLLAGRCRWGERDFRNAAFNALDLDNKDWRKP